MAQADKKHAIARRGLMLVLSSPSGAGKTTLSRMLLERERNVALSISMTTRPRRPGEIDGGHYYFVTQAQFDRMARNREFLEFAKVFGNSYGTPRAPIEKALSQGHDVLFDVDWQGTKQLRRKAARDLVSVFVLPPSIPELKRRLRSRAQDSTKVIAARMSKASSEMSHWQEYDYIIVNHDLDEAYVEVRAILAAERLKRARQTGLPKFVRQLKAKL
jgi:guanylate kinase